MLEMLKRLVADLGSGEKPVAQFDENDYRLSAAALLFHVSAIDGNVSQAERDKLHAILKSRFNLGDAQTEALIAAATAADQEAVDLYHFTSQINRSLDEEGRKRIVEMMWDMVYADGEVNEFEDNVVWRAADLLGISSRQRIEARQDAAAQAKSEPES
jgi:uncharacterized tellurite resistance protein B-like protein